jgi:transposase-like protein
MDGALFSDAGMQARGDRASPKWKCVLVRSSRYLNNIVEQDHRAINAAVAIQQMLDRLNGWRSSLS